MTRPLLWASLVSATVPSATQQPMSPAVGIVIGHVTCSDTQRSPTFESATRQAILTDHDMTLDDIVLKEQKKSPRPAAEDPANP